MYACTVACGMVCIGTAGGANEARGITDNGFSGMRGVTSDVNDDEEEDDEEDEEDEEKAVLEVVCVSLSLTSCSGLRTADARVDSGRGAVFNASTERGSVASAGEEEKETGGAGEEEEEEEEEEEDAA